MRLNGRPQSTQRAKHDRHTAPAAESCTGSRLLPARISDPTATEGNLQSGDCKQKCAALGQKESPSWSLKRPHSPFAACSLLKIPSLVCAQRTTYMYSRYAVHNECITRCRIFPTKLILSQRGMCTLRNRSACLMTATGALFLPSVTSKM